MSKDITIALMALLVMLTVPGCISVSTNEGKP